MRTRITTGLDAIGVSLVAAGLGVQVATWSVAGGLVTAGAVILGASWLADRGRST